MTALEANTRPQGLESKNFAAPMLFFTIDIIYLDFNSTTKQPDNTQSRLMAPIPWTKRREEHQKELDSLRPDFGKFVDQYNRADCNQSAPSEDNLQRLKLFGADVRDQLDQLIMDVLGRDLEWSELGHTIDKSLYLTMKMRELDEKVANLKKAVNPWWSRYEISLDGRVERAKLALRGGYARKGYLHEDMVITSKRATYQVIQEFVKWRVMFDQHQNDPEPASAPPKAKPDSRESSRSRSPKLVLEYAKDRQEMNLRCLEREQVGIDIAAVRERCDDFLDEARDAMARISDVITQVQSPIRSLPIREAEFQELTLLRVLIGKAKVVERLCNSDWLDMLSGTYEAGRLANRLLGSKALRDHFEVQMYAGVDAMVFCGRVTRSQPKEHEREWSNRLLQPDPSRPKDPRDFCPKRPDDYDMQQAGLKMTSAILVERLAHDLGLADVKEAQALQDFLSAEHGLPVDGLARQHALELYGLYPLQFQESDFVNEVNAQRSAPEQIPELDWAMKNSLFIL